MRRQDDNDQTSSLRSAARESMQSGKEAGAAWGGKAVGALVSVLLLIPQFIFSLVIGFTDLFIQFIGIKNAATDALYTTTTRNMFRIVGSLILGVGVLEGLVTANIISQFGVGTEMEQLAFWLACVIGPLVGYLMVKIDVSIYTADTTSANNGKYQWKLVTGYAVRVGMAIAYPLITAVGVLLFVLQSEVEQNLFTKEQAAIVMIKDAQIAHIRTQEEADEIAIRTKNTEARKSLNDKFDGEYKAHMSNLEQQRAAAIKSSKLIAVLEGVAAAEAARNTFEKNETEWQESFKERKRKALAQIDTDLGDSLRKARDHGKGLEKEIQDLTPEQVATRYDGQWVIKRSFYNKLAALDELLVAHPDMQVVANFVKYGILVFVSLLLVLKIRQPDDVKTYFSAHAQAAAGDEKMKKSLEVGNGNAEKLLKAEAEAAAAESKARVEAKELEMQAQIQARQIELEGQLAEAEASAAEIRAQIQERQIELQGPLAEAKAAHQRRLGEIAIEQAQRKRAEEKADLDAEVKAEQTREREHNRQAVQALRQKWVEHLRAVVVGSAAVIDEMKHLDEFSMTAFKAAVEHFLNPGLILMCTVEEALELVYGQSPPAWPSKVPYPDPRGKTPQELAVQLGFVTEDDLEWDVLGTNPNHQAGMTNDDAAFADEGTAVMRDPPPPRPRRSGQPT